VSKKTLAIDFDGCLSAYTGWKGEQHLEPPLPGAIEALRGYLEHYQVVIFTTRAATQEGRDALDEWFVRAGFTDYELLSRAGSFSVTDRKAPAWLYIDDRCLCFNGTNWPSLEQIDGFKPYWQK
jgi:hypothetical protein